MLDGIKAKGFEVLTLHHAEAILLHDTGEAAAEIEEALLDLELPAAELVKGGGGESALTQRLRRALVRRGWEKHCFEIKKVVDGEERESTSHEVDHARKFGPWTVALEIEWNNKDPFFDRDLENYKRLHIEGAISLGVLITRGASLQDALEATVERFAREHGITSLDGLRAYYSPTRRQEKNIERSVGRAGDFARGWAHAFIADKFGQATTHWRKLLDRVNRGAGNPCPLLLIGIPADIVTF